MLAHIMTPVVAVTLRRKVETLPDCIVRRFEVK